MTFTNFNTFEQMILDVVTKARGARLGVNTNA